MGVETTLEVLQKLITDLGNETDAKIAELSRRLTKVEQNKVMDERENIPKLLTVFLTFGAVIYLVYMIAIFIKEFRNDFKMS
jgi:hypothetical protein